MPFTYTFDSDRGVAEVVFVGATSTRDLGVARERVMSDPAYDPRYGLLVNLVAADLSQMSPALLRTRAQDRPGTAPMAILVSTDMAYGMGRMYELASPLAVGVFRDRVEALAWLASSPSAG